MRRGGEEDPTKLVYQASISDVTRSCSRAGGTLTINVAVAGKVVPGPAGKAGPVTLPIRIVILRGEEILYSQLHKHQVAVGNTSTQWIFSHPNVSIPIPAEQNLEVFAGFDEGPPKRRSKCPPEKSLERTANGNSCASGAHVPECTLRSGSHNHHFRRAPANFGSDTEVSRVF